MIFSWGTFGMVSLHWAFSGISPVPGSTMILWLSNATRAVGSATNTGNAVGYR
jgi:hypothetical protein